MIKLKLNNELDKEKTSSSCCSGGNTVISAEKIALQKPCCSDTAKGRSAWITGSVMTPLGSIPKVSTELSRSDYWEHFKCRINSFRNNYTVNPGLYAVGSPDNNSDVLVSANYKFSFDMLRSSLNAKEMNCSPSPSPSPARGEGNILADTIVGKTRSKNSPPLTGGDEGEGDTLRSTNKTSMNAWILVLDTKGINVWCAAGKGTFGTEELINRIAATRLKEIASSGRIIVPQLGAPGVSAHKVKSATGFNVVFGPVLAKDIPAFISKGYKATREMRTVTFSLWDRLVLTPIELHQIRRKFLLYALITLVYFGLEPSGVIFREAFSGGLPFVLLGFMSVIAGAILTPLLLPYIPFRSFAIKGWLVGALIVFLSVSVFSMPDQHNMPLLIFSCLFFPLISSYLALQFTGATTFTGMTGVKKELKIAAPLYICGAVISIIILIINKLGGWRII